MPSDSYEVATLVASGAADVALSPDHSRLYVARENGNIDVFDVATHQKIDSWDIGTRLGAISVSEGGTFLLVVEQQPAAGKSTLYRVNAATGVRQTFSKNGSGPFNDVEIVDADTALISGGQGQVTIFNPLTAKFSSLVGGVFYGNSSVLTEDSRYTLFAEPGISNGPLFLYDDQAGAIVADGDTYSGGNSGFNWGSQAVSEEAGLVIQFIYYGTLRLYDLNLDFQKEVQIGEPIVGLAFSDSGKAAYIYLASGFVVKYSSTTWTEVDRFEVAPVNWHNDIGYGSQLLLAEGGRYISVLDYESSSGRLQLIDLTDSSETLVGTSGADTIDGLGGNDVLDGRDGDDRLDGGVGNDTTKGGKGNDVHIVSQAGDSVVEAAGEGVDEVRTMLAQYSLAGTHIENLTGLGDLGQTFTGNAAANVLNGGAGADTLTGGAGDDLYIVDNSLDSVTEASGGGTDTIRASVGRTLPDHFENLIFVGGAHLNGAGNALANAITGNDGNNRLDGRAGADAMAGGKGHDVYVVGQSGDTVTEAGSSGIDTVESAVSFRLPTHVEKLILTGSFGIDGRGNSGANTITGNGGRNFLNASSGDDIIDGGGGNDRLLGGAGTDSLKGGAGEDRFEFTTALGAANVDRILDFSAADDSLYLLRSVFSRAGANGVLGAAAFHHGSAAADADDRILYDAATGRIFYDADGTGAAAAMLFATVTPGTALTNADFVIYG